MTEEKDTNVFTPRPPIVEQKSLLLKKLPAEMLSQICDHLGPAGQRLLGATCLTLYQVFKQKYKTDESYIRFEYTNWEGILIVSGRDMLGFTWSAAYEKIMVDWMSPKDSAARSIRDRREFCRTMRRQLEWFDENDIQAHSWRKGKVIIES
ncbi:uncharacterized protein LY89DRAFT_739868 [Mollisia scopiformis]|uniref:F-box domain-containing protein n=1 Tax=Mollisia scopiformis TaxID=149040 RepID=A0A194WSE5_MOLSC|nr:uncharacterized protein LY89DRAFT_739868 [Mollisia scopiformis]KUJ10886.1 hypothetical protein LY89DRAFT_739868 [Mollisia scopiformis]